MTTGAAAGRSIAVSQRPSPHASTPAGDGLPALEGEGRVLRPRVFRRRAGAPGAVRLPRPASAPPGTHAPGSSEARRPRRGAALALLLLTPVAACKPADEPAREELADASASGSGPEEESVHAWARPGSDDDVNAAQRATVRLVAPDASGAGSDERPEQAPADAASAERGGEPDAELPGRPESGLADTVGMTASEARQQLGEPVGEEARGKARRLHAKGRRRHRKLKVPAAIEAYEKALESWPRFERARFDLARALALRGRTDEAMTQLRLLDALGTDKAEDLLREARVSTDFETLRRNDDFRALTHHVAVGIRASPGTPEGTVDEIVAALRRARVPARALDAADEAVERTTLRVHPEVSGAEAMARSVEEELAELRIRRREVEGVSRPGLVLILAPDAAPETDPASSLRTPRDFVGHALTARHEGWVEHLELEETGFFTWKRVGPDGKRISRTGRYVLDIPDEGDAAAAEDGAGSGDSADAGELRLDYRRVVETPRPGREPDVAVERGRRKTLDVRVDGGQLDVGERRFARSE